jgi:hypothetical protein
MGAVVIGMDPHKRSATIEVLAADERVLGGGRYGTDAAGYAAMLASVRRWPQRTWAIEGCQGIGRHIAARLVAAGEQVVDVPPKLSARTRVFTAGQTLLAYSAQAARLKSSRWRWVVRVRSRGLPVHQASSRSRLTAAAAAVCSRRVLSRPM